MYFSSINLNVKIFRGINFIKSQLLWEGFREIIKEKHPEIGIWKTERFDFYNQVKQDGVALVVQMGETMDYACLILTIGSL